MVNGRERKALWGLVIVLLLAALYVFFQRTVLINHGRTEHDFYVYYTAAHEYARGEAFYNPAPYPLTQSNPLQNVDIAGANALHAYRPYIYLPFLAWALTPVTSLPYPLVEHAWTWFITIAYFIAVGMVLAYYCKRGQLNGFEIAGWVLVALFWIPAYTAILAGQITPIVLVLLGGHYLLWRSNWYLASGALLGLAVLLKVSPVVLLVLWVLQKNGRVIAGCGLVVFLGIVGSGVAETSYFITKMFPHLMMGENDPVNFSLMGFTHRWVVGPPWGWLTPQQIASHTMYLVLIKALLAGGWIVSAWGIWKPMDARAVRLTLAVFFSAMILLSPVARHYDFIYFYVVMIWVYLEFKHDRLLSALWVVLFTVVLNTIPLPVYEARLPGWMIDFLQKPAFLSAFLLWGYSLIRQKQAIYRKQESGLELH
jgi:hypothetical protein